MFPYTLSNLWSPYHCTFTPGSHLVVLEDGMDCAEHFLRNTTQCTVFFIRTHHCGQFICFSGLLRDASGSFIERSSLRGLHESFFVIRDDLIDSDGFIVENMRLNIFLFWPRHCRPSQWWPITVKKWTANAMYIPVPYEQLKLISLRLTSPSTNPHMKVEKHFERTRNCRRMPQCRLQTFRFKRRMNIRSAFDVQYKTFLLSENAVQQIRHMGILVTMHLHNQSAE